MAETIKKTELQAQAREAAISRFGFGGEILIGTNEYAVPSGVMDGETEIYVSIKVTAKNSRETDEVPAFDIDTASAAYQAELAEKAAKAEKKAADKAAKDKLAADKKAAAKAAKEATAE